MLTAKHYFLKRGEAPLLFPARGIYSILDCAPKQTQAVWYPLEGKGRTGVAKRKPGRFSATKAVKANARERVGQPKPVKVVDDAPRTGRRAKHKPKLEEVIERGQ